MILTAYIIDDEPHAVETLTRYATGTTGLKLLGSSTDAHRALAVLQETRPPMLAFIDIDLPGISGLTLADHCRENTLVVFTTSFREYGPEAFEKNALDYLLKPFSRERFLLAVDKARNAWAARLAERDSLFIRPVNRGKKERILLDDLQVIEGAENYVLLHIGEHKTMALLTLQDLLAALPSQRFLRIHKSFVINLDRVSAVRAADVTMDNEMVVPVGRVFAAEFQRVMRQRSAS